MGTYKRKDHFYKKAKEEGLSSRASYKLEQIQKKYRIIKRGDKILDLGCAPGGWVQIASKIVGPEGMIFGIDLLPIKINLPQNATYLQGDITDAEKISRIKECINEADVVVSDMAPDTTGIKFRDSYLSYELALEALEIAGKILKKSGNFVTKIFPGEEFDQYKKVLMKHFEKVVQFRPEATRKTSIEVYLIGLKFNGLLPK